MFWLLWILGGLFFLVGFVFYIIIVVAAFKESVGQGFLSLCIFPYTIYYGFARMQSPKKMIITGACLGCYVIGYALYAVGTSMAVSAMNDFSQDLSKEMQQEMNKTVQEQMEKAAGAVAVPVPTTPVAAPAPEAAPAPAPAPTEPEAAVEEGGDEEPAVGAGGGRKGGRKGGKGGKRGGEGGKRGGKGQRNQ